MVIESTLVSELTVCVKPQEELVGQLIICLLIKIHFVTYSLVFFSAWDLKKRLSPLLITGHFYLFSTHKGQTNIVNTIDRPLYC